MTAGVLSSLLAGSDTPMAKGTVPLSAKETRLSGIWAPAYHMGLSPNTTLQHVCGNEELIFCVLSVSGLPLLLLLLFPLVF